MLRKLQTHANPASLLALIALFVSLGGVSYAAATIGSAEIKDGSIKSKDVKDRTLTGKDVKANALGGGQINEATLGKVPSAASADSAGQAQSAATAQTAQSATTAQTAQSAVTAQSAQSASSVGPGGVGPGALQSESVTASALGEVQFRSQQITVPAGGSAFDTVECQPGDQMLSGGAMWIGSGIATDAPNLHIVHSYPVGTNGWAVRAYNGDADARDIDIRVVCLAA